MKLSQLVLAVFCLMSIGSTVFAEGHEPAEPAITTAARFCQIALSGGAPKFVHDQTQIEYLNNSLALYDLVLKTGNEFGWRSQITEASLGRPHWFVVDISSFSSRAAQKVLKQIVFALPPATVKELMTLMSEGSDVEIAREFSNFIKEGRGAFYKSLSYWTGFAIGYSLDHILGLHLGLIAPVISAAILHSKYPGNAQNGIVAMAERMPHLLEERRRLQYLENNMPTILSNDVKLDDLKELARDVVRRSDIMDVVLKTGVKLKVVQTPEQYLELIKIYKESLTGEFPAFAQILSTTDSVVVFDSLNPTEDEKNKYSKLLSVALAQ